MSKKHIFLSVFSKIAIFACVFCTFFASPVFATLPAGYTELEYIESSGTQHINTGIVLQNKKIGVILDFQLLSGASGDMLIGGTQNDNKSNYRFGIWSYANVTQWRTKINNVAYYSGDFDLQRHLLYFNSAQGTKLDNTVIDSSQYTISSNNNLFILYDGTGQYLRASAKIYSLQVYDDTTLVRNFIPAKRISDNVVGMYDMATNTFFTNQGTGNFIAGPVAEIKIATTKMVDDEFAQAEANLAATVQTIESVVSRTITQTGQIATLQAEKQTRPDETCPANMKCLLVQDEDGTPHWYPIIEP